MFVASLAYCLWIMMRQQLLWVVAGVALLLAAIQLGGPAAPSPAKDPLPGRKQPV